MWLEFRGGTGVFDKNGVMLAAGDHAPFMRSTWNELVKRHMAFLPEKKRLTISELGKERCNRIRGEKEMDGAIHLRTEKDAIEADEYEYDS